MANVWGPQFEHLIIAMDGNLEAMGLISPRIKISTVSFRASKGRASVNLSLIIRTLADTKPDLVLTYNWGAIEWAALFPFHRRPIIHVEDGFGPEEAKHLLPRRTIARRVIFTFGVKRVIVISERLQTIAETLWKVNPERLSFINNGVDVGRFSPTKNFETQPLEPATIVIGTVCGLRREKRIDRLITAMSIVSTKTSRKLVLKIVGDGIDRNILEAQAKSHATQFETIFLGARSDTEAIIPTFDIFAMSSDTEQAPIAILEAMACGVPVASLDVGDVKTMVSANNRPFIAGSDEESLVTSLLKLIESTETRQIVGQSNRRDCEIRHSFVESALLWKKTLLSTKARS